MTDGAIGVTVSVSRFAPKKGFQFISTITAKVQTAKMHLSCATADQHLSNYIYNRLPYLQMHLLKCWWWVCSIQNSKAFQIE